MIILGISCSPRKGGNTEIFIKEAIKGASTGEGVKTEIIYINDMKITPCQGCLQCKTTEKCQISDDMNKIYKKMLEANGIIFATPVYMWSMTGQAKVLLDRTYSIQRKLANKVGGIISVATRQGNSNTINVFTHYFISNNMFIAGYVDALAKEKGTAFKDKRGMKSCYELGRKMAAMIKLQYTYPKEYDKPFSEIVAKKYGINNPYPVIEEY